MANILADSRWIGPHGIGRFAGEVLKRLPDWAHMEDRRSPTHPLDPLRVARTLKRLRPDAYFSPGFNPPLRSVTPFVFTIHDLIHLQFRRKSSMFKRAYYGLVVRPAARRAFKVLTVSDYSKRQIVAWADLPEEKVLVVGNGVARPFVPTGPQHRPPYRYLLHVGSHRPHKNIPRLLEAFAALGTDCETRLVFTGQAEPVPYPSYLFCIHPELHPPFLIITIPFIPIKRNPGKFDTDIIAVAGAGKNFKIYFQTELIKAGFFK